MYIYNVTVNIEDAAHDKWLAWMKETHILDVLATKLFIDCKLTEVLVDHEQGRTYSIQYTVKDEETLKLYQEVYAKKLQQEHRDLFEGKFVAFRTLLRVEGHFQNTDPR